MTRHTPETVLACLEELGIAQETHRHEAVFTVAESVPVKVGIPGAHTKNLFLKDKRGAFFLVTAKDDTRIDLKRLHVALCASGRLSFGSGELLFESLGVAPGSVTPLAAINAAAGRIRVILDARLMEFDRVNIHPLVNTMTTGLAPRDLVSFLTKCGHPPTILALPAPPGD